MMPFYFHEVMLMSSWQPAPAAVWGLVGQAPNHSYRAWFSCRVCWLPPRGCHRWPARGSAAQGMSSFQKWSSCFQPWALLCSLGVLPSPAFGVIFHPGASPSLACAPLAGLYRVGLLSKQLKLPFVHLFNGSPPHITLVRDRIHRFTEPPSWKPSSFWLASSQPSISVTRALCRAHGCFCLSAPTGGLENTGFLAELLFGLKKKKKKSTWLS